MIKLFRNIRKKLLQEGKTTNYLKYAIGEIVLVVIGILIALQVNNANEQRKENDRVKKFLVKFQRQINQNLENIKNEDEKNNEDLSLSKDLLKLIYTDTVTNIETTLDNVVGLNVFDYHLNLDMLSLEEAINNGDITLIKSDSLLKYIYKFIKLNKDTIERERIINEDLNNNFKPYLNEKYNIRNLLYRFGFTELGKSTLYKNDNVNVLLSQEFENLLTTRIMFKEEMALSYYELTEVVTKINEEITSITND